MNHCWSLFFFWLLGGKLGCLYFLFFTWSCLHTGDKFWPLSVCHQLLTSDSWVPCAAGAGSCGAKRKEISQFSGLLYSPKHIMVSFKSISKYTNPNGVHPRRMVYLILSHQNSSERSLRNTISAVLALYGELDLMISAGSLPALIIIWSFYQPHMVSPDRTSKLAPSLCWNLVANSSRRLWRSPQNYIRK